jgi:hypothetical protein
MPRPSRVANSPASALFSVRSTIEPGLSGWGSGCGGASATPRSRPPQPDGVEGEIGAAGEGEMILQFWAKQLSGAVLMP